VRFCLARLFFRQRRLADGLQNMVNQLVAITPFRLDLMEWYPDQ